ncbi:MAG: M23 family metallopeptidase [Treponema sp.]|jgi:murein DD-endopeptidase MepM/ murein hydrolase activator NlpD|nr:M23 family metallopeptidase [Treponema sp.]
MLSFIEDQRVSRRRSSHLHRVPRHKPDIYGADFIRQIKQKPAHIRRGQSGNAAPAFRPQRSLFAFLKSGRPVRKYGTGTTDKRGPALFGGETRPYGTAGNRTGPRTGGAGFSFPVPSLMTLAVIAGTLVISLLALNWEGFSVPEPQTFVFEPGPDEEGKRNLASYAGISGAYAEVPLTGVQTGDGETVEADGHEIPLDLTETFAWSSYQVQKGDSVSKIAAKFGISMDAVIASNDIRNARRLREGEVLRLPNIDGIPYTIKKGDSLSKIAQSQGVPLEVILDANDIRSDDIRQGEVLFLPGARMAPEALKLALGELFIYPVRSRVTSPFGWRISPITGERHYHAALDLAGATGTTVKAAMDGTVSTVGVNPTFGKFIILSHDGGYQTMYAHLSAASVRQGDRVSQGGKIGEVGATGLSTGPHLHFAVYKNGRAVNPLDLLN